MGLGKVIAIFWTINDPPGRQELKGVSKQFLGKIINYVISLSMDVVQNERIEMNHN